MTTQPSRVGYLPPQLALELRMWAPDEVSGSEMFNLRRLVERVYAAGYDDGHRAGYQDYQDDRKRPNTNDVQRLRAALAEKASGK